MKLPNPVILVDTREQTPLMFPGNPTARASLYSGDYSIRGAEHLFAVERKTLDDLAASCCDSKRAAFERELLRLRGCRFRRLLIVGSKQDLVAGRYRSYMKPTSLLHSVRAFEMRYDVPVVWEADADAAAQRIALWASWFAREIGKDSYNVSRTPQATAA